MSKKLYLKYSPPIYLFIVSLLFLYFVIEGKSLCDKANECKVNTQTASIISADDYNHPLAKETNETHNLCNSLSTYSHLFFILFLLLYFSNVCYYLYTQDHRKHSGYFLQRKIYLSVRNFRI
jgi:hypothetical protein